MPHNPARIADSLPVGSVLGELLPLTTFPSKSGFRIAHFLSPVAARASGVPDEQQSGPVAGLLLTASLISQFSGFSCSHAVPLGPQTAESRTTSPQRSEEHTSELQSQFHLVCRLLLEKKKK